MSKPATSLSVSPKLSLDDVIGKFWETQSTVWQAAKVSWISRAWFHNTKEERAEGKSRRFGLLWHGAVDKLKLFFPPTEGFSDFQTFFL